MTTSHPIDVERLLADQLASASSDLLRGLLSTFIAALMSAEADPLRGAGYSERSSERSKGAAETVTSRVARGQGNGVSDGFDCWLQRFRKSSAGCLMPWRSARTCGLASKYSCT